MENVANTSSRTLRLLSLLQTRRYWPGEELAGQLRVSPRTLRRDIDRLRELGYPIQAQRGVAGGYQLAAGSALPPLVVDDEEAVALAVGLQAAAQGAGAPGAVEGIAEASVRALAKVVQVMPARLRRRVQALGAVTVPAGWEAVGGAARETVDPEVLTALALACRDTERVRFSYTAAGGEQADREVEPHRLVLLGRRWYLVGYDLDRQDWRSYRLDRLAAPNGTGVRFRARELPGGDAAAFVRAGVQSTRTGYDIEVIVEAPASVVTRADRPVVFGVRDRRRPVPGPDDRRHAGVAGHGAGPDRRRIPGHLAARADRVDARLGRPVQPRRAAVG